MRSSLNLVHKHSMYFAFLMEMTKCAVNFLFFLPLSFFCLGLPNVAAQWHNRQSKRGRKAPLPFLCLHKQTFRYNPLTGSTSQNAVQLPDSLLRNTHRHSPALPHSIQTTAVQTRTSGLSHSGGQVSTQNSCRGMKSHRTGKQNTRRHVGQVLRMHWCSYGVTPSYPGQSL